MASLMNPRLDFKYKRSTPLCWTSVISAMPPGTIATSRFDSHAKSKEAIDAGMKPNQETNLPNIGT
jgi:hypothetical protein